MISSIFLAMPKRGNYLGLDEMYMAVLKDAIIVLYIRRGWKNVAPRVVDRKTMKEID